MDTNKKIIVGVVGLVLTGVLVFGVAGISFPGSSSREMADGLEFDSPNLDVDKFDNSTKKQLYDKNGEHDSDRYDSLADNLSFLQKMKSKLLKEKEEPEEIPDVNQDLQMLMELQNSLNNPAAQTNMAYAPPPPAPPKKVIPQEGNYFFGAASAQKKTGENLIPAETIDQGVLKQGATIALRTKHPIVIPKQNIRIPKGAVIYGVVSIEDTRLIININRYKRDNTLYAINLDAYDYDGLQGIHLNNRSLFSIPSNVSKDVYNAALQTYQQQSALIGSRDQRIPLDKVAILSAAKEVSRELFDKRRVFVPRKYHIWLTINTQDDDK